jgi:hypothetical protein
MLEVDVRMETFGQTRLLVGMAPIDLGCRVPIMVEGKSPPRPSGFSRSFQAAIPTAYACRAAVRLVAG